ncbi:LCP family protein [Spirochaetota bacterium]
MKFKKKIIIISVVLVAALIVIFIYNNYKLSTRNAIEKLVLDKKLINIIVAGSNRYDNNKHKLYLIVSINPDNSNIGITFIPPSFRVYLKEGSDRVCRIDELDFVDFDKLKRTLKKDLKLNVPFYIELYSLDVKRIVDLIEGINVFILDQVKNDGEIKFGNNYLDGDKAVKYINYAQENSIYVKFDRILDVLFSLYYHREDKKKFLNFDFIRELVKTTKSNLLPQEILKISDIVYNKGNVMATVLPGVMKNKHYILDDISFKIYEKEFLTKLILTEDIENIAKIKILNGTNVPGLARRMRSRLIRDGFNVVQFGTSPYRKLKDSIIICRKGNFSLVNKISVNTGIKKIYYIIDSTQLNNILIIIGEDYKSGSKSKSRE